MLKKNRNPEQLSMYPSFFTYQPKLDPNNRWIILSELVPWEEIEEKYSPLFAEDGAPAIPIRIAVGSLIIKERLGLTDDDTVYSITENPYLQRFLGYDQFSIIPPFDQSSLTHFRKRFTKEIMNEINEMICTSEKAMALLKQEIKKNDDDTPQTPGTGGSEEFETNASQDEKHEGTLIIDATCVPADIHYPTDVTLLNDARELTEQMIDILHAPYKGKRIKTRDYRERARKQFLAFTRLRKPGYKTIRRTIRKQLGYVARNLRLIQEMGSTYDTLTLPKQLCQKILTIQKLYHQQHEMYKKKVHRIDDRIVSIHQSHVRPIVRGKAGADVEFGAKISVSICNGLAFLDVMSFDNYNESKYLEHAVFEYKRRFGYLPATVLVDQIYRNRDNRKFCKKNHIRMNGPNLGRPKDITKEEKAVNRIDEGQRNRVEGKFGEAKRRYGLSRILTRLPETSGSAIATTCLVMNLEHLLRLFLFSFFNVRLFKKIIDDLFMNIEYFLEHYWAKKLTFQ